MNRCKCVLLAVMMLCCSILITGCSKTTYLDVTTLFENDEGITYKDDSVSFDNRRYSKLFADCIVEEGEGFAISYTVQGNDPNYLYVNSGGLYVELEEEVADEIEGFGKNLWHNVIIFHHPWQQPNNANASVYIIENCAYAQKGDGAFYTSDMAFGHSSNSIDVEIVYYNEAYYVRLDHSSKIKLTADTALKNSERIHAEKFFKSGARKIGFRSAETGATFSKVNYSIGNEAALKSLEKMKMDV